MTATTNSHETRKFTNKNIHAKQEARRKHGKEIREEKMENQQEVLQEFGKRIQRCYGCFIAYHLKDMYLGEDVTFFCDHCKDETMFHFDDFARLLDISKLKEVAEEEHHH